jgi:hypothetical protein
MRKIEQQMVEAILKNQAFSLDNTVVTPISGANCSVYLYGNHIADVNTPTGFVIVNIDTLKRYPTNTTKSRLRAMGIDIKTSKGITYLNDEAI